MDRNEKIAIAGTTVAVGGLLAYLLMTKKPTITVRTAVKTSEVVKTPTVHTTPTPTHTTIHTSPPPPSVSPAPPLLAPPGSEPVIVGLCGYTTAPVRIKYNGYWTTTVEGKGTVIYTPPGSTYTVEVYSNGQWIPCFSSNEYLQGAGPNKFICIYANPVNYCATYGKPYPTTTVHKTTVHKTTVHKTTVHTTKTEVPPPTTHTSPIARRSPIIASPPRVPSPSPISSIRTPSPIIHTSFRRPPIIFGTPPIVPSPRLRIPLL